MDLISLMNLLKLGLIVTSVAALQATGDVSTNEFLRLMPHNKLIVKSEGETFAMACIVSIEDVNVDDDKYEIYWSHSVHGRIGRSKFRDYGRSVFVNNRNSRYKLMIHFNPVMRDDAGEWTCSAVNNDGELISKSFKFEVFDPTRFENEFVTQTVNENEDAFLPCEPNGYPKPEIIQWEYDGSTIENDNSTEIMKSGLLLTNVNRDMEGNYTCRAHQVTDTVSSTAEKTFNVIVNYAPIIETENKTVYGMLYSEIKLACYAQGRPDPTFAWYHGNKHITGNILQDDESSILTIHLKSSHKFGYYNCKARNALGARRAHFNVVEGKLPEVPDTFRLLGRSTTSLDIEIGAESVELYPITGYRFELISKEKYEDAEGFFINPNIYDVERTHEVSNVIIHGLSKDTTYMVRVAARNELGQSKWTDVKEFSTLMETHQQIATVIVPPYFEDSLVTITVNKNEEGLLPCNPSGHPKPDTVIWEHNGSMIDVNSTEFIINNDGLFFKNVERSMEGTYKCKVHQTVGMSSNIAEKTFKVIVNYAPVMSNKKKQIIYGVLNGTLNLSCRANGRPNPTFIWSLGEKLITEDIVHHVENSTLTVHLDSLNKFGIYNCKARNSQGTNRAQFHIVEGKLPEVPDTFRVLGRSTTSVDIEIGAKKEEHFPVLGYRLELIAKKDYKDVQSSWNNSKIQDVYNRTYEVSSVIVHGLKKNKAYLVRAAARNALGLSEWTQAEEFTTLLSINHRIRTKDDFVQDPAKVVTVASPQSAANALTSSLSAILTVMLVVAVRFFNTKCQ